MGFLNPFKRYTIYDFDSAFVPLAQAPPLHSSEVKDNAACCISIPLLISETRADKGAKTVVNNIHPSTREAKLKQQKTEHSFNSSTDGDFEQCLTIETLRAEVNRDVSASGRNSAYDRKSKVVNKAIQDIGMGRYQWQLFVLCGFGWFADDLWLQTVALTLPSLQKEFHISVTNVRFTTLSTFVGLCIGAVFWGVVSDMVGRRPAFNVTLLLTVIFGTAVGGAPSWIAVCALYAVLGFSIGGNLPIVSALFLEFLPGSDGDLLTLLSIFWPLGQLYSSLVGWEFLPAVIPQIIGARLLLFHLFESPKFLLSHGRQKEAVMVVRAIAWHNKTKTWLSEEILNEIGDGDGEAVAERVLDTADPTAFRLQEAGFNTVLLWFIWACIGLAYPLFDAFLVQYLTAASPNVPATPPSMTYRNYAIVSAAGCPGSIIAWYTVQIKHIGRRWTMAISLLLTGIFLFLSTISTNSDSQLSFSCMVAFFQNAAYGVLYVYSDETFPALNRGTGIGISSFFNRVAGLYAPLIAIYGAGETQRSRFMSLELYSSSRSSVPHPCRLNEGEADLISRAGGGCIDILWIGFYHIPFLRRDKNPLQENVFI